MALKTRQDVIDLAVQWLEPLLKHMSPGKARLELGGAGAYYDEGIAGMEGFSRALWAIVPMLKGRVPEAERFWQAWKQGLIAGTDPQNDEYWGDIGNFDQRAVEMAVMGMALILIPERFWGELNEKQQRNLEAWLNQINTHEVCHNNWVFFRILVNIGLKHAGGHWNEEQLKKDLKSIDEHYDRDGWYADKPDQRDYYNMWAFHYYGLVFAEAEKQHPQSAVYRERAQALLPRFACWLDGQGRALPYGRSITYRFAEGAFLAACAFAGIEAEGIGMGEIKGMLLKHLTYWSKQPILDNGGVLTIGYGYAQSVMAEGYNAVGSPYWGMKIFLMLALKEDHPFWQAEAKDHLPPLTLADLGARQLICRDKNNTQVFGYPAGNHAYEHNMERCKYEKFVYSTHFGFSVFKDTSSLHRTAADSMLAFRDENGCWHTRYGQERFEIGEDHVMSVWSPMKGVRVKTTIIPCGECHARYHVIDCDRELLCAEGGFACARDAAGRGPGFRIQAVRTEEKEFACAASPLGTSAILAVQGYDHAEVLWPEPNTNLIHGRTLIPTLYAKLQKGRNVLISAVLGSVNSLDAAAVRASLTDCLEHMKAAANEEDDK